MELRRLIRDFQRDALPGTAVLRAFVAHDDWAVPAEFGPDGPAPLLSVDDAGGKWFQSFTDADAMHGYLAAHGDADRLWLKLGGGAIVDLLTDDLAGWNVDPLAPDALHYRREQFPMLRRMVTATRIERILTGEEGVTAHPFGMMRDYAGYGLVMRAAPDGKSQMVLAPDDRGRRLAAVFTAPDTLDAFVDVVKSQLGLIPIVVTVGGVELFRQLSTMPLDGIVFNCAGPVYPKALALQFANAVLQGN